MIDVFDKYRTEHDIACMETPQSLCLNLRFTHEDGCREFCRGWSLVPMPDGTFTVVYHIDSSLNDFEFEDAWDFIGDLYRDCSMTFGEIDGMWENGGFPRLYCNVRKDSRKTVLTSRFDRAFITIACALRAVWFYYRQNLSDEDAKKLYGDAALVRFIESNIIPLDRLSKVAECGAESCTYLSDMKRDMEEGAWETGDGKGFSRVAGFGELKTRLSDTVLWTLRHKEEAERYRIAPPNAMLLYGPPGCGKTYFARNFAAEAGYRFKVFTPSDLGNPFVHGSQNLISEMFAEARRQAPCVVCLDEVDAMIPQRSDSPSALAKNDEVNEFLSQMNDCGRDGVFLIGTTNKKDLIDRAALRTGRFDLQVEIPMPDEGQREALFTLHLEGRPLSGDIDAAELSSISEGMTASDITYIVNDAALSCARRGADISQDALRIAATSLRESRRKDTGKKIGFQR